MSMTDDGDEGNPALMPRRLTIWDLDWKQEKTATRERKKANTFYQLLIKRDAALIAWKARRQQLADQYQRGLRLHRRHFTWHTAPPRGED